MSLLRTHCENGVRRSQSFIYIDREAALIAWLPIVRVDGLVKDGA
jgi:hypothetical protein